MHTPPRRFTAQRNVHSARQQQWPWRIGINVIPSGTTKMQLTLERQSFNLAVEIVWRRRTGCRGRQHQRGQDKRCKSGHGPHCCFALHR